MKLVLRGNKNYQESGKIPLLFKYKEKIYVFSHFPNEKYIDLKFEGIFIRYGDNPKKGEMMISVPDFAKDQIAPPNWIYRLTFPSEMEEAKRAVMSFAVSVTKSPRQKYMLPTSVLTDKIIQN